jgi:hypothetical protein
MAYREGYSKRLERIMNQLSDSVLGLSDEAIVAEVSEAGADPEKEAERTRGVLLNACEILDKLSGRLSTLGHTIDSSNWQRGPLGYHNSCLNCGSSVSFTIATAETRGSAIRTACRESGQYKISHTGTVS